jgi:hypothetical protein
MLLYVTFGMDKGREKRLEEEFTPDFQSQEIIRIIGSLSVLKWQMNYTILKSSLHPMP